LEKYTAAALPFLDALTTWGAIVTTYMVANKVLENWIYWFVIDSISIYLFISRGLYFTALLFFLYLFMIVIGYRSWKRSYTDING
jgi:nicotinamide mononucleotide transporter